MEADSAYTNGQSASFENASIARPHWARKYMTVTEGFWLVVPTTTLMEICPRLRFSGFPYEYAHMCIKASPANAYGYHYFFEKMEEEYLNFVAEAEVVTLKCSLATLTINYNNESCLHGDFIITAYPNADDKKIYKTIPFKGHLILSNFTSEAFSSDTKPFFTFGETEVIATFDFHLYNKLTSQKTASLQPTTIAIRKSSSRSSSYGVFFKNAKSALFQGKVDKSTT